MNNNYYENAERMRVHFQKLLEVEKGHKAAEQIKEQLLYIDALSDGKCDLVLPNTIFADTLNIIDQRNRVELSNYYNGHTECNTVSIFW